MKHVISQSVNCTESTERDGWACPWDMRRGLKRGRESNVPEGVVKQTKGDSLLHQRILKDLHEVLSLLLLSFPMDTKHASPTTRFITTLINSVAYYLLAITFKIKLSLQVFNVLFKKVSLVKHFRRLTSE